MLVHATCHTAAKPYPYVNKTTYLPCCPPTTLLRQDTTSRPNRLRSKPSIGEFGGAGYTRAIANDGIRPLADVDDDDDDDGEDDDDGDNGLEVQSKEV